MGHLVLGSPSDAAAVEAPAEPRLVRAVGAVRGGGVRSVRATRQHLAGDALRVEGLHLHGGDHGLAALHPGGGCQLAGGRVGTEKGLLSTVSAAAVSPGICQM